MKIGSNKYFLSVTDYFKRAAFMQRLLFAFLDVRLVIVTLFLLVFFSQSLLSQNLGFSIALKGNYTSTSRYFPSSGITTTYTTGTEEEYYSMDDLFGFGAELRYNISERMRIGLSGEFVSGEANYSINRFISIIPAKSKYNMYIFELNGYYNIPLSGEKLKFYIGGGANLASANSFDQIADLKSELLSSPIDIGIQALTGFEYFFKENFSARWEMKFRDPMVENENAFKQPRVTYEGRNYSVSTKNFTTKINIDGIIFELSMAYHF